MRCKRICRELLWLARFGEFGPSSAPHLDHLAQCRNCRDEVGFDRALVQQLRVVLAERIEQANPSPGTWGVILERAQAPERGIVAFLHSQAAAIAARLRIATAVTAMALAGIIATSTHVAITHPAAGSAETEVMRSSAGEQFERSPLIPRPRFEAVRVPVLYAASVAPTDPEAAFLVGAALASSAPTSAEQMVDPAIEETAIESEISLVVPVSRALPADPARTPSASVEIVVDSDVDVAAGEPF